LAAGHPHNPVAPMLKLKDINKSKGWKFDGRNLYPLTCPSYYRVYGYTHYILYDDAGRHPSFGRWNEDLSIVFIAPKIREDQLIDANSDVEEEYHKLGIPLNKRKFCGVPDVFLCVDPAPD
jgi:hypothetical protein